MISLNSRSFLSRSFIIQLKVKTTNNSVVKKIISVTWKLAQNVGDHISLPVPDSLSSAPKFR